jgi:hypothetical protein
VYDEPDRQVTVLVHPEFAEPAGRRGRDCWRGGVTGKKLRGRILLVNKKAWAAKFKKYAIHGATPNGANRAVTLRGNLRKKLSDLNAKRG